ncbi:MAG TPA: hypothetical protein PLO67_13330 [Saprospiraceae bacterium]|nr:hypothetical protein [Saprospiraceae bacterium]HPI07629.1 hypothetical protein [Saprospiraceae bacterium]
MNEHQENTPDQKEGIQKQFSETAAFDTVEEARQFFRVARERMLDVNNWQHISDGLSSTFLLRNAHGEPVGHRLPEVGDYMQIDIPGPGPQAGDGHDWVRVEAVEDNQSATADEMMLMRVRPAASPLNLQGEVAHFLDDRATSTFVVFRIGSRVTAEVFGSDEVANTESSSLLDKVRNVATAVAAWLGFSDVQWNNLVKAVVAQ